jgi:hypothetical protein
MALLERVAPPPALAARLLRLADEAGAMPAPRLTAARIVPTLVAMAAGLLLALGIGAFSQAADRVDVPGAPAATGGVVAEAVVIDDPGVPLFHDLETFGLLEGRTPDSWGEGGR